MLQGCSFVSTQCWISIYSTLTIAQSLQSLAVFGSLLLWQIRKQVIKDLPLLCRSYPSNVNRVADVLTQLMQSDDSTELSLVNMSLVTMLKTNAKGPSSLACLIFCFCFFKLYLPQRFQGMSWLVGLFQAISAVSLLGCVQNANWIMSSCCHRLILIIYCFIMQWEYGGIDGETGKQNNYKYSEN